MKLVRDSSGFGRASRGKPHLLSRATGLAATRCVAECCIATKGPLDIRAESRAQQAPRAQSPTWRNVPVGHCARQRRAVPSTSARKRAAGRINGLSLQPDATVSCGAVSRSPPPLREEARAQQKQRAQSPRAILGRRTYPSRVACNGCREAHSSSARKRAHSRINGLTLQPGATVLSAARRV